MEHLTEVYGRTYLVLGVEVNGVGHDLGLDDQQDIILGSQLLRRRGGGGDRWLD